jgi:hypothetical protein
LKRRCFTRAATTPITPTWSGPSLRAWPAALCLAVVPFQPRRRPHGDAAGLLPFEIVHESDHHPAPATTIAFLRRGTLHMALAAVELATGRSTLVESASAGAGDAFQRHVQDTVARFLPADPQLRSSSSGLEVAQSSLLHLESPLDLCRALFCDEETRTRLHADGGFRGAVLGDTASGLYALNRRGGRFRMSASHQVDLLEFVTDNLDLHLPAVPRSGVPRAALQQCCGARARRRCRSQQHVPAT